MGDGEVEGGGQQRLGVGVPAGWRRSASDGPFLDHLAVLQHHHVVRQRAHHLQIVADEQVGEVVPLLQVAQQVDDLRLHRHVERAGRLVEQHELRLQHHGAGDGDALALAAGELVRIAVLRGGIEADLLQRRADALAPLLVAHAGALDEQPFLDDLADRQARRERAVGVLEDDLHLLAQRPHALGVEAVDALADVGDRPLRGDEAQQRQAERGLAGARTRRPRPASRRRAA